MHLLAHAHLNGLKNNENPAWQTDGNPATMFICSIFAKTTRKSFGTKL
jgi:hypothetical protein